VPARPVRGRVRGRVRSPCRRQGAADARLVNDAAPQRRNVPLREVAHIGHVELLTPTPDESLRFFVDVMGMTEAARDGQSVHLRAWGDYQAASLKLTESPDAGLGHMALRTWGPEELDRRVRAIEQTGLGLDWIDGDHGPGPAYRFEDPDGHVME